MNLGWKLIVGLPLSIVLLGWFLLNAEPIGNHRAGARSTAIAEMRLTPTPMPDPTPSPTPTPPAELHVDQDVADLRKLRQSLQAMIEGMQKDAALLEHLELRMESRKYGKMLPFTMQHGRAPRATPTPKGESE